MGHTILIVDDSSIFRQVIQRALDIVGVDCERVIGLGSAEEALQLLEQERVDLVLADVRLPGISGIEMVETIRSKPWGRDLPIVMVSTMNLTEQWVRLRPLGVRQFVQKPFAPEDIGHAVGAVLRARQRDVKQVITGVMIEVLEKVAFAMCEPGDRCPAALPDDAYRLDITIGVGAARLTLFFPIPLGRELASNMSGEDLTGAGDSMVADALGELSNMIAGNLLEILSVSREATALVGLPAWTRCQAGESLPGAAFVVTVDGAPIFVLAADWPG